MANSICLPNLEQIIKILSMALFKLRIVWQTKRKFLFLFILHISKMQLQATFLYRCYFHIQGEQKGLADPNVNLDFISDLSSILICCCYIQGLYSSATKATC